MRGFYGMATTDGVAWRRHGFEGFMFTMLRRAIAMQAGLLIAAIAVREGIEAWKGDGCADCAPIGFNSPGSQDDCCP